MSMTAYNLLLAIALALTACSADAQAIQTPENETPGRSADPVATPEVLDLLNAVEAAAAKLDTLKARIKYTRTQGLTGDEQVRYGQFYYAAGTDDTPTRVAVRFDRLVIMDIKETTRKMRTWYIFDGNWLLERDEIARQAVRRELVPEGAERDGALSLGDGQMPIPLKLKAAEILDAYHAQPLGAFEYEEGEHKFQLNGLRLTPRKGGGDAVAMDLWFDSKTMLLFGVKTTEDADDIQILLPYPGLNDEIDPDTFSTQLPKASDGWDINEVPIRG